MRTLAAVAAAAALVLLLASAAPARGRTVALPREIAPSLGGGPFVFPVAGGDTAMSNSFAAFRLDVSYHHGDDLFAPLGTPVLAVTDGTLYSVGRNHVGGNRLWLRDAAGDEFYYAHLVAFSPLVQDGSDVHAGDLVGYVGKSGDAESTPPHLHFEVHPAALIALGYDGAIDPWPYLSSWRRILDPAPPAPAASAVTLVVTTDISTASGLRPGSVLRASGAAAAPPRSAVRRGR